MNHDVLNDLDEAFEGRADASSPPPTSQARSVAPPPTVGRRPTVPLRDRLPWVEWFVYVQFLWGALLFLPGAQAYRPVIRVLPYAVSTALLFLYVPVRTTFARAPGSTSFLIAALAVLVANLLHPTSQLLSGVAQCVFQLMIVAPAFWAWKAVRDERRLLKILRIIFVLNMLSTGMGMLQVYFPDRFLPPQFSVLGLQLSDTWVDQLSYEGSGGRKIIRPPGLTDQPGGASIAGTLSAVIGLGLTLVSSSGAARLLGLGGAGLGLFVLYLTQVRSLLLMCVAAFGVMAALMFRRGRFAAGSWLVAGGAALVLSAFAWAVSVGGERVEERFTDMARRGAMQTYRENRGLFLSYTVGELLDQYPLGAGVGRWGMMFIYFGDPGDAAAPPIYVEIQPTGWLLDGGVPLWVCYGGAILAAFATGWRLSTQRFSPPVADLATIVLPMLLAIAGMGLAGPIFNTQVGILFWFLASALHGSGSDFLRRRSRRYLVSIRPA